MGVCLTEDVRAAAVSDWKALVKPIGNSVSEAIVCEDISVLEPEESGFSRWETERLFRPIFRICVQTAQRQHKAIALFTGLAQTAFSLSDGKLYVCADSLMKAAEAFSHVMSKLDRVQRYVALSRKSTDILSSFFQR